MAHVILGLLMISPATLYELGKRFEAGVSLFYSASLGSIRSALQRLLAAGHVDVVEHVENGRNKKTYSVTTAGRDEFSRWMAEPITGSNIEVAALSRMFFLGLLPGDADRAAVVDGIIERVRADLAGLEAYAVELDRLELPEEQTEVFRHQRATLDYGVHQNRAALTWCEQYRRTLSGA